MKDSRWEVGSMLQWEDNIAPPFCPLPETAVYYMLGRHAIAAVCAAQSRKPVLWLPSFLCPEIAQFCYAVATIREYRDDCRWPEPDWRSLQPGNSDLVLAVNYFGVKDPEPWLRWREKNRCILIEDHTQDPFSAWALESSAEYAICSLRKTVPIPDGAILWSPAGRPLPNAPGQGNWDGTVHKLAAMLYKREYLDGNSEPETKVRYREWQLQGEREASDNLICAMSPVAEAVLSRGIPKSWRERRIQNARTLVAALQTLQVAEPVFRNWPKGHAPFDVPLVFRTQRERDAYQEVLRDQSIYCPVEWPCHSPDATARDLSSRILSIPIDHRYSVDDITRVANAILATEPQLQTSGELAGANRS